MSRLLKLTPNQFVAHLKGLQINSFNFTFRNNQVKSSHPELQDLANTLMDNSDMDSHEGLFFSVGTKSGVLQSAAVHKTKRGPGAGGIRNWHYDSMEAFIRDGLRLSKGMTLKNALAKLEWGGGKGVMARNSGTGLMPGDSNQERLNAYQDYGEFLTKLHGCYIAAEDVGTTTEDLAATYSRSRYVTCIPPSLGGSGNPSVPTARGVVCGIEAAFEHCGKTIKGSSFAVQGAGHVGLPLIHYLFEKGAAKVVASEVDSFKTDSIKDEFKSYNFELKMTERGNNDILFKDVDCVVPCAVGGTINSETIPKIKASIICGAANNQLLDPFTDDGVCDRNDKLFVPDFLVNRMGIVNCADEHMGVLYPDPNHEKHLGKTWDNSIYKLCQTVFAEAKANGRTPNQIALEIASKRSDEISPVYGHRGQRIIDYLISNKIN